MGQLARGSIGILPAGALGVSFYYHLTRSLAAQDDSVFFVERAGSRSAATLRNAGRLQILDAKGSHRVDLSTRLHGDLEACSREGRLPELLLVCPNPDQLLPSLSACVGLLETAHSRQGLTLDDLPLPALALCSNGIYFQRIRQVFIEKLEEATLMGRLPDLWPHLMPRIVGKLLRGVTIQTGIRDGEGAEAQYSPGPPGVTKIAGGDTATRHRAHALLRERGLHVELAEGATPTRVEFDKAMVNLVANLLGQLSAIGEDGRFTVVTIGDVLRIVGAARIRSLGERVVEIGRAVRAYGAEESAGPIIEEVIANLREHSAHIPSSVQWLDLRQGRGEPVREISPTELWLLDPLIHYARSADLQEAVHYFESLKREIQSRLAKLVVNARQTPGPT
ncbi:MAG: hypothetical protein HYR88_13950 [Verrucomicrobia bacterium]|nr:hypothetical protein [Verrucomicrobiota bacterium]MBI3869902.1 hypothetical protein [Verrucomicrobiota bacterium]